jgi:hypothetical protein
MDTGAGNRYQPLTLTNNGGLPCYLEGVPRAALYNGAQARIAVAEFEEGNPARRVELAPGGSASTLLRWASDGTPPCAESMSLQVRPPGDPEPILLRDVVIRMCANDSFTVRNLVAGTTGMADDAS